MQFDRKPDKLLSDPFFLSISFYRYWFRSNLSITPGSANLEILINKKTKTKQKNKTTQKNSKNLSQFCTLTHVAAHVILKIRKKDAMNDALIEPLSNYREGASKLTGISSKTLSRIKAESEKVVLGPRKPRSEEMKPSYFDKCEICINFKITHKQDNKLYIIKKKYI